MALGLKKKAAKPAKPVVKASVPAPVPSVPAAKDSPVPAYKFTARQSAFMDHWMISRNQTDAAIKAGFSKRAAKEQGHRTITNAHVRAELDRRIAAQKDKMEISADRIVRELAALAFANMGDYMRAGADGSPRLDFSNLSRDQSAALESVTVEEFKDGRSDKREVRRTKFKLGDKAKALELLGKRFKLFTDPEESDRQSRQMSIIEYMLMRIDAESRAKTIEHQK